MYIKMNVRNHKNRDKFLTLHREDSSSIEYENGSKYWYLDGKFHREGAPAIEHSTGDKWWHINGELHREDGPAREYADGGKAYYFNNNYYPNIKTDREWIKFLKLKNFE